MATVSLPYSFTAGTAARASEVNANFDAILEQLNGNLQAVNLANESVTENKLADGAVATAKLADAAVTNAKVAGGISASKVGAGTVGDTAFGYLDGVTSAIQAQLNGKQSTLGAGDISTSLIADDAVTQAKIAAGAVGSTEIADDAVIMAKIGPQAVGSTELFDGGVVTTKLADLAVSGDKTTFWSTMDSIYTAAYVGRVAGNGTAVRLPSGWSVTGGSGTYTITHGLGTTNFVIIAMPNDGTALIAYSTNRTTTTVQVNFSGSQNVSFDFIVIRY
jgi:hypothetical protein